MRVELPERSSLTKSLANEIKPSRGAVLLFATVRRYGETASAELRRSP